MSMSKAEVLAIYESALERAKIPDSLGNKNADLSKEAFHMTRSEVHAALQARGGNPASPDLWKDTDKLVATAGITEKGRVS